MPVSKQNQRVREWLRENGYNDIADSIDSLISKWKKDGKKTRRNWWEVLAGGKNGEPRTVDGVEFPVLQVARARQKLSRIDGALTLSKKEPKQRQWKTNRWK
jgi:hypothetical protein